MAIKLETVVPFGRSLAEYRQMFALTEADLQKRIVGVADGPASFNAELTQVGGQVTSIDPIYELEREHILQRFNRVVDDIIHQIKATPDDWVWGYHGSPEGLRANRVRTIHTFLQDYEAGTQKGRYRVGSLPHLAEATGQYDLALCSHFLFLYSEHHSYQFHFDSIMELLRIASEVRIFPLLTLALQRSAYLDSTLHQLTTSGFQVSLEQVPYELQKGGNQMLRIQKQL